MIFGLAAPWFWLIAGVVFVVLEAITVQLVSVWFAVGAFAAMIAALLGTSVVTQLLIFAVLSLVLMVVLFPIARKRLQTHTSPTNADRIVGGKAVVIETIDNRAGTGQIRIMSQTWTARSVYADIVIPKGEEVVVDSISGVKAMVVQCNTGGNKV